MSDETNQPRWSLPFRSTVPSDPAARRRAKRLRVAMWALVALAAILPVVRFQTSTMKRLRRVEAFDRAHPNWCLATATVPRPPAHKGAIGRWRKAVHQFWNGRNLYHIIPPNHRALTTQPVSSVDSPTDYGPTYMHPNHPAVLVLLTPFAYLPVWAMALCYNLAKLLALGATVLMAARLAGHRGRTIVDWVVLLGLLWTLPLVMADVSHGNTNVFALAAIVLHLWLYRRGHDVLAGGPLALAILLKMTPALFLPYWLYQRNGKLLAGAAAGLIAFGVLVPAAAVGPGHYADLTATWYRNIVRKPAIEGSWYPEHINQSLSGVLSRYFLAGPNGDIYWGPDDDPHYQTTEHGWITLFDLGDRTARWLLRGVQAAILLLGAWAIGWRKLPRDDGRRALHYALVLLAMMLLNQRTWNHHAAVLLPAGVALWQAIAFGRVSRAARVWAFACALGAGLCVWLARGDFFKGLARLAGQNKAQANAFADLAKAVGPTFYYLAALFAAGVVLALSLRRAEDPYALQRQKLLTSTPNPRG